MARIAIATSLLAALAAACSGSPVRTDGLEGAPCGGLAGLQCPPGQVCVDDPRDACSPAVDCASVCVTPVFCGGIAGIPCPAGRTCVDDPRDDCAPPGGADCGGLCAPAECAPEACGPPLGMPNWLCPDGTVGGPTGRCLPRPEGGCGWEVLWCDGAPCGGLAGLQCPAGQVCVDDPRDACSPAVDCASVCVKPVFCGGIAGIPCPDGQTCVDDPRDDCAPPNGADCGGLCAPAP